jgi:cobalt-zinc-cadmium efflux system membrane fusion protein
LLAIPSSGVVDANGKKLVYVQNGDAFQPVEVTLGQTSGDMVEVKTGSGGDNPLNENWSIRGGFGRYPACASTVCSIFAGGSKKPEAQGAALAPSQVTDSSKSSSQLPWWLVIPAGGGVAAIAVREIYLDLKKIFSDTIQSFE